MESHSNKLKSLDCIYLLLIGIAIGGIIACVIATTVIFRAYDLNPAVDISMPGIVMGNIFLRFGIYLQFLFAVMVIYELISIKINANYSKLWFLFGAINAVCIALITWYYIPYLITVDNMGTEEFDNLHKQSSLVFKILLVGLGLLFISRAYKLK